MSFLLAFLILELGVSSSNFTVETEASVATCQSNGLFSSICCTDRQAAIEVTCVPHSSKRQLQEHQHQRLVSPTWNTYPFIGGVVNPWGDSDTRIYGQSFVAPAGFSSLDDFQFRVQVAAGTTVSYRAFVTDWNPVTSTATSYLYQGPTRFYVSSGSDDVVVSPLVPIVAGQTYCMFLWAESFGARGNWLLGFGPANNPTGGSFVFLNIGVPPTNPSLALNTPWSNWGDSFVALEVKFGQSVVNPNGRICRPSANFTAPCGPAFQDWLSRGGFAQVSNTTAIYTNASVSGVPFCGSSPVRSTFSFSSNTNGALGTGTFTTADGSCTCDYCYPLEDFDLSSMLPMCFSQSSSGFGITQQIFNSAPNSVGLNITTSSAPVSQSLTSGEFLLFKKQVKFWIRTELVSGESVSVSIVQNSITYVVPAAALVGSCSFNNAANTAWILQNRCTVTINLCLVPGVNPIAALQLRFSYSPPMTKRVDPVITTPPALPLRGFWIDTIQACGTNTC
jgi:hypothetical protein